MPNPGYTSPPRLLGIFMEQKYLSLGVAEHQSARDRVVRQKTSIAHKISRLMGCFGHYLVSCERVAVATCKFSHPDTRGHLPNSLISFCVSRITPCGGKAALSTFFSFQSIQLPHDERAILSRRSYNKCPFIFGRARAQIK